MAKKSFMQVFYIAALLACASASAETYYVSYERGNNGYAGTDRSKPLKDISFAVNTRSTGSSDVVVLLAGTFPLTSTVTFKAGMTITGETGDPKEVIVDCQGKCRAFSMGASASDAMLASVTVVNGRATGNGSGGGVSTSSSKGGSSYLHTVSNCVFSRCSTTGGETTFYTGPYGGAINCRNGGLTVIDTVFTNCQADAGGALSVDYWINMSNGEESAPVRLEGCTFVDNCSTNGTLSGKYANAVLGGGAVCVVDNWLSTLNADPGDGIPSYSHGIVMEGCTFARNVCSNGNGGAVNGLVISAKDCDFSGNCSEEPLATTNHFGGAWACLLDKAYDFFASRTTNVFERCTFAGNGTSGFGGGCAWAGQYGTLFSNCVFRGNTARADAPAFAQFNSQKFTSKTVKSVYAGFHGCSFLNHTNMQVRGQYELIGAGTAYNSFVCFIGSTLHGEFFDCAVSNNYGNGTGILSIGSDVSVDRCVFANNVLGNNQSAELSTAGEGAYGGRTFRIQGIVKTFAYNYNDNVCVRNTFFVSNRCERTSGGAIAFCDTMNRNFWIENNTFIGNGTAMRDATVEAEINNAGVRPNAIFAHLTNTGAIPASHINNNLFCGNYDLDNPSAVQDVYCNYAVKNGSTDGVVSNCFFATLATVGTAIGNGVQGCIAGKDPKFVDATQGDWRVRGSSKARGAGLLLDWMTAEATDLLGEPRTRDGQVDLGCYQAFFPGFTVIFR